jgi:hypothetical protein
LLVSGKALEGRMEGDELVIDLPTLGLFEVVQVFGPGVPAR